MDNVEIFEVRECRDEYVAAVNRLLRQLDGESPVFTRSNLETIAGSEASCLFLLSCGGEIVGMASLCVYVSPIGRKAWIEDVVVDSRFRGRSFGKFLVMHILERARKLGRLTVMLTSRPSRIAANALSFRGFRNQGNQRLYKEDLAGQAHASFCRRTEFSWQSLFLSQISVTLHRLRFAFRPRKGVFMQLKGKRVGIPHNPVAVCLSESAVCAFAMSLEDNVSPYLRV